MDFGAAFEVLLSMVVNRIVRQVPFQKGVDPSRRLIEYRR